MEGQQAGMYQSPSKYWREAATLIIASGSGRSWFPGLQSRTDNDYAILHLQRSAKSNFMPHRHVYPGGAVDSADFSADWINLFTKVLGVKFDEVVQSLPHKCPRPPMMSADRKLPLPAEIAFRICAIRETFEEAGILLARKHLPHRYSEDPKSLYGQTFSLGKNTRIWRNKVKDDASTFLEIFADHNMVPDLWALAEWSNWLTPTTEQRREPPKKPMRFDTMFYICCLSENPRTSHDKSETVQHMWLSLPKLLNDYRHKKLNMAGPQIYEPCRLARFPGLHDLHQFSHQRQWLGMERTLPVIVICTDGPVAVYEGDDLYPEDPDAEGVHPVTISDKTIQELAASGRRNRMLLQAGRDASSLRELPPDCNVQLKYGHVSPISQSYLYGKL